MLRRFTAQMKALKNSFLLLIGQNAKYFLLEIGFSKILKIPRLMSVRSISIKNDARQDIANANNWIWHCQQRLMLFLPLYLPRIACVSPIAPCVFPITLSYCQTSREYSDCYDRSHDIFCTTVRSRFSFCLVRFNYRVQLPPIATVGCYAVKVFRC